jgi:lysophospholipase L1-like esterase
VIALGVAAACGLSAVVGPAAAATTRTYHEYVSLGDSWTADVVLLSAHGVPSTEFAPFDCAQAPYNYPRQVARVLGISNFRDASCGSATSEHFAAPQTGLPLGGTNPPQFDRLTKTTDLVTVGIGGNDIGLATAILPCVTLLPFSVCRPAPGAVDPIDAAIAVQEPLIVDRIKAIKPRVAANARIVMVNYIAGVPQAGCWPYVPISNYDMPWIYAKFTALNAMVKRIATKAGVGLIDAYTPTIGHDVCKSPFVRYVEPLIPLSVNDLAVGIPFHPNSAGADAQAQIVISGLLR